MEDPQFGFERSWQFQYGSMQVKGLCVLSIEEVQNLSTPYPVPFAYNQCGDPGCSESGNISSAYPWSCLMAICILMDQLPSSSTAGENMQFMSSTPSLQHQSIAVRQSFFWQCACVGICWCIETGINIGPVMGGGHFSGYIIPDRFQGTAVIYQSECPWYLDCPVTFHQKSN